MPQKIKIKHVESNVLVLIHLCNGGKLFTTDDSSRYAGQTALLIAETTSSVGNVTDCSDCCGRNKLT